MKRLGIAVSVLGLAVWVFAGAAMAASFPSQPIKIIVNYAPGGGHDLIARALQTPLSKALGVPVVVENIPAGSTKVGTMTLMKAAPDGYTLCLQANEGWVGYYYSKTYDEKFWLKLTPIADVIDMPSGLIEVRADGPYKTWQDLVKEAKKRPGELTCGGPSGGGKNELMFHMVCDAAGIKAKYVPFPGAGPAQTAMLGGHVDFHNTNLSQAAAMIKAGKSRGLAISTPQRFRSFPDIPTYIELGIGPAIVAPLNMWGPGGIPQDIVNTLANGIKKAMEDQKYLDFVENQMYSLAVFRPGSEVMKETIAFDTNWGPKLATQFK